ncbi:MAG: hypothetical protein IKO61_09985 [Lachnospiraceae bacterium]|nr:hypothetical protein [Lachnospiraceae bacterium]
MKQENDNWLMFDEESNETTTNAWQNTKQITTDNKRKTKSGKIFIVVVLTVIISGITGITIYRAIIDKKSELDDLQAHTDKVMQNDISEASVPITVDTNDFEEAISKGYGYFEGYLLDVRDNEYALSDDLVATYSELVFTNSWQSDVDYEDFRSHKEEWLKFCTDISIICATVEKYDTEQIDGIVVDAIYGITEDDNVAEWILANMTSDYIASRTQQIILGTANE